MVWFSWTGVSECLIVTTLYSGVVPMLSKLSTWFDIKVGVC